MYPSPYSTLCACLSGCSQVNLPVTTCVHWRWKNLKIWYTVDYYSTIKEKKVIFCHLWQMNGPRRELTIDHLWPLHQTLLDGWDLLVPADLDSSGRWIKYRLRNILVSSQVQENLSDYHVSLGVSMSSQCWFITLTLSSIILNEMLKKLASNNLEMLPFVIFQLFYFPLS